VSSSVTKIEGMRNPIATPNGIETVVMVVEITLSCSPNQMAERKAGQLVMNGCPMAANTYPVMHSQKP